MQGRCRGGGGGRQQVPPVIFFFQSGMVMIIIALYPIMIIFATTFLKGVSGPPGPVERLFKGWGSCTEAFHHP